MKKVIFIHQIQYPHHPDFPEKYSDDYFYYGLGRLILENLKQQTDIKFENWRLDPGVNTHVGKIVKGVKCRIFPAFHLRWKKINFSFSMLRALKKEVKKGRTLVHVMNTHTFDFIAIARYLKKFPIVASHLGGAHPLYKFKQEKKILSLLKYLLEKFTLKNVDEIFASVTAERDYFTKVLKGGKVCFGPNQGVEEEFLKTSSKSKSVSRQKLGIPVEKKVLLTVGRLEREMGSDETLKAFERLKSEHDMIWIAVGTAESNSYYQQAKDAGVVLHGYISRDHGLMDYYAAADVFSYPMYHDLLTLKFGGTGMATLEALFFDLPYVGNGIVHIPNNDGLSAGIIPNNTQELYLGIKKAFDHPDQFGKTREIVFNYYSWESVIKKYLDSYQRLFHLYDNESENAGYMS